jgi:hypothetical protein
LGEPAKLSAEQKKKYFLSWGERIEVGARCREVRNSVESAMYEPVVIMQLQTLPLTPALAPQSEARSLTKVYNNFYDTLQRDEE